MRYHWDVYAIIEAPQELYFGHEVEVNVNKVELVTIQGPNPEDKVPKAYISPTKRRGVERRVLLWAPRGPEHTLGDHLECGIPATCANVNPDDGDPCPICSIYGALQPGKKTVIGRLSHGGGVAIQALPPEEKQRAMHPSRLVRESGKSNDGSKEEPTPFRREYDQPGLYFPVYNHALSVSEDEFAAAAYAFINALPRLGAGNPKGASWAYESDFGPMVVLDRYWVPSGERPVISPHESDSNRAFASFKERARNVRGAAISNGVAQSEMFTRWTGDAALAQLESLAADFVRRYLVA